LLGTILIIERGKKKKKKGRKSKIESVSTIFFSRGGFHNAFGDRPIKWLIAKKKNRLKQLCFGMHHN
jgi:hypothetical protein